MIRPLGRRVTTLLPVVTLGLVGASTGAQQTIPTPSSQPEPKPTPVLGRQDQNDQKQTPTRTQAPQAPNSVQDLNPAAVRYGLPRNPTLGGQVDTDLNKVLTLDRAVRIGLARQDSIAIAQTQVDAANARVVQARSLYYPQVTPTFQYQNSLQPGAFFNSATGAVQNGGISSETRTELIAAKQLLYDGGKREANVGFARRSAFGSEYGLANQRQAVILTVTQAYQNLLRDRDIVKEQQATAARAQTTRDVIKAQVDAGVAAQSDLAQADADLANARVNVYVAQAGYGVDQASLKNAMGIVTAQPILLPDASAPVPDTRADPVSLEAYVRQAYLNRLDSKQQQEQVYAAGYNVRLAQINAGLSVDAELTEGYQFDPNAGEDRSFFVSLSYPLFDGGNTRAAVRENKAALEQNKRNLDALEQDIRLQVEQAYVTREQNRQRIVAAQAAVTAAKTNYEVAIAKQQNGLVNIPEVIIAQNQLSTADIQLIQAIYDFYVADAQLKRSTAVNDPVFLPKVPGARPPVLQPR